MDPGMPFEEPTAADSEQAEAAVMEDAIDLAAAAVDAGVDAPAFRFHFAALDGADTKAAGALADGDASASTGAEADGGTGAASAGTAGAGTAGAGTAQKKRASDPSPPLPFLGQAISAAAAAGVDQQMTTDALQASAHMRPPSGALAKRQRLPSVNPASASAAAVAASVMAATQSSAP